MRRIAVISIVLAVALVLVGGAAVFAGSAYTNARVDFEAEQAPAPDARGHAIINYAEGAEFWQIQVQFHNLEPNKHYEVAVVTTPANERVQIAQFTTDSRGRGQAHNVLYASDYPNLTQYDYANVTDEDGNEVMLAQENGAAGTIVFHGSQRH